ncbi:hypothetical protein PVIIG_02464 [Plasmodium vivax India VII]|uniref:Uncharacterized protein n=1 Tax=Plasmodium vivax India VII TaxID=1077284 RepID=A0A0J9SI45_PLAVI|nr:hypothetical protein PVIIG_02464 [Plasmodium vivax India VII]
MAKPVLLNKYLLLKSNSLKVQSKLIEKYFVDLYKRKHFLKDMFLKFNNLKRKKKKYINVSYQEMTKCLDKYCHLLLENDEGVTINYLFFFFLYANMLIKNVYSAMMERPTRWSFYQFASHSKENFPTCEIAYEIAYEKRVNYNLFFFLTIDVERLIKFALFVCNSFASARRMCSLFFIHPHRVLVQNVATQCCLKNASPAVPPSLGKDPPEGIFTPSFLRADAPNVGVAPRRPPLGRNYLGEKPAEQPEEKHLTGEFLFFLTDVVGKLEQLKRRISPPERKQRKKKTCKLKLLLLKYVQHAIDTQEGVAPPAGRGGPSEVSPEVTADVSAAQHSSISTKQPADENPSAEDKDELIDLFLCLEKCDDYFPFIFNTLYGYAFSAKYPFLNRLIVERYSCVERIFWVFHREGGASAGSLLQAVSRVSGVKAVSQADIVGDAHHADTANRVSDAHRAGTAIDLHCLKYGDLERLNGFTKCLLYSAIFDSQHNVDCLHLYQLVKAPKGGVNMNPLTKKLNRFYSPLLGKAYSASTEEALNDPFKSKRNKVSAPRSFPRKEELLAYLLRETTPLESLLDVIVNLFMQDGHTLSRMTLQEVILIVDTSYQRCQAFRREGQAVLEYSLRSSDEVDFSSFGRLPSTLRGNVAKLGVYVRAIQVVRKVQRVLNEEVSLPNGGLPHSGGLPHNGSPPEPSHRSTTKSGLWVRTLKAILAEPMGEQAVLQFILQNRLFKHAPFLLNYKLGPITSVSKRETLLKLERRCKAAYIVHLWRSNNPKKKKKIISFLKNLKGEREVKALLSSVLHDLDSHNLKDLFSFVLRHFETPFVKKLYLLALVSPSLCLHSIGRIKMRDLISSLLWRDKTELVRFILRKDLYRPRLHTLFRHAFLNIHLDFSRRVSPKESLSKEGPTRRKHCPGGTHRENALPYSLTKCLSVLELAGLVRGEGTAQQVYETFLRVTQVLFDRVCDGVSGRVSGLVSGQVSGQVIDRLGERFPNRFAVGCAKLKRLPPMNRPSKGKTQKEPPPRGKLKKKFSLFGQFFHKRLNANGVKTKGRSANSAYVRHYKIVQSESPPAQRYPQSSGGNPPISLSILIYTFYKVCFFFYESYGELRRGSNLLCFLLPQLIYVQTSLRFRVNLKKVIKLNLKEMIDLLRVKNFNLCNQLIHRIHSCYIYQVNSFGLLAEPTLFFPLDSAKRRGSKYKAVKNIVSLLRCSEGGLPRGGLPKEELPLRRVHNYYVYRCAHSTCVYRQFVDAAGVVAGELGAGQGRGLPQRGAMKRSRENRSGANAVGGSDLPLKLQRLHFSVLAFHVALLYKCGMDLYVSLNLFFSFTCTYHCSSNVCKKYRELITFFANVNVHKGAKVLGRVSTHVGVNHWPAYKLMRRCSRIDMPASRHRPGVLHKMVLQVNSGGGSHPWKGCTYLGHIRLEPKKRDSLPKGGEDPSITYHLVRSDDGASTHQGVVPNRSGNLLPSCRLNWVDLLWGGAFNVSVNGTFNVSMNGAFSSSVNGLYSPSASIYVRRHLLTGVAFAYLYGYHNDVHFGGDCREIPSVSALTQKELLLYVMGRVHNPYVVIRKGVHPAEGRPLRLRGGPQSAGGGLKRGTTHWGNTTRRRLSSGGANMTRRADLSRADQLRNTQKTFTFSNYLKQKRANRSINLFAYKLEAFQEFIKMIYNESLQRNTFEYFASVQLANHYERFFYNMGDPCTYPLCYAHPCSNLALSPQYFRESFHEVCAHMALSTCDGRVDGGARAGKARNLLFATSLLLPHGSR